MLFDPRKMDLKSYTDAMLDWVRGRGKILVVVHDNPDPDCLASAMALRHLFVMKLNTDAVISFSGMIGRSENLAMAKELEMPLTPLDLLDLKEFQVVCMLDTQPGTGNNSLPPDKRVDIVIDHHPMRDGSLQSPWIDIREDYGVTATILYEYLSAQDVYISTKVATALYYAIKSETQDLGREANRPDREAYVRLSPLTNKKLLFEITHPKLPVENFVALDRALKHTRIYETLLVSCLYDVSFPEVVAEMADLLIRLEGIETVLCMGRYANELILSMRTIRHDLNLGEVIRRLVHGMGMAGGHGMTAGGKIANLPADPEKIKEVEDVLLGRLLRDFDLAGVAPRPLLKE